MRQLEDVLRPDQVLQAALPQVAQAHSLGEVVAHQLLGGAGEQHLPPMGGGSQPGAAIECGTVVIVLSPLGLTGVQGDPHPQRRE
jgi:hypothetical protein